MRNITASFRIDVRRFIVRHARYIFINIIAIYIR